MLLNPCFAFLSVDTIINCLQDFETSTADYATSVKPFSNYLFDVVGNPITHIDYTDINTKAIPPMYQMAHCFHIFNVDEFLSTGNMLKPGHNLYEISEIEAIDVDTEDEFNIVKELYYVYS